MPFINSTQTILRKSNGDILNFYIINKTLFLRKFKNNKGWEKHIEIISKISNNNLDIKIDNNDKIYGIICTDNGKVLYIYTDSSNNIKYNNLFDFNINKYLLKYPVIQKINSTLHILYYLLDKNYKNLFGIIHHYYDGNKWIKNNINIIKVFPIINPFIISYNSNILNIFYFNKIKNAEEVFVNSFESTSKTWSEAIQLTNNNKKKLYLNVLNNDLYSHNIIWSEFVDDNLVIKYMNCSLKKEEITSSKIISLSKPSNCSFPTFIKTQTALWAIWVEMDKVVSCYSFDNGKNWSESNVYTDSSKYNFIKYKFDTNFKDDLQNFKVHSIFGTYYPKISFIGFKNLKLKNSKE
ncbi:hypothetical protein [Caminicella sporogenes]|uniref:hypothetical protein n=1 Tax=Caminicella sporogenes TaxID=166485 RepID=UPI0025419DFB|nr:hypothetical protein [Caminicella sporogenes]WIF94838.1 hypothetical protein QNI18_11335 [Caminicella sporogenes]